MIITQLYFVLTLAPKLLSTLYIIIYLMIITKCKVELLLFLFHRWEISQVGNVGMNQHPEADLLHLD